MNAASRARQEARLNERAAASACESRLEPACVVCGRQPTVKSHLLPAAVGRDIKGDQRSFLVGSRRHDGKTITQSGIFDRILCDPHERALHDYEEAAIAFCRTLAITAAERSRGVFIRHGVEANMLVRFACSVLWRYHQSRRIEARGVDVGGWEPALRAVTFDGDMRRAPEVLTLVVDAPPVPADRFAVSPSRGRFDDRVVWHIVLYGLAFVVKLDKRPFPKVQHQTGVINGRDHIGGKVQRLTVADIREMQAITRRMKRGGPMR